MKQGIDMDAVRELIAQFSADRDELLLALDQCRSQLTRLGGRLVMEQARVDEVEDLRTELARALQIAERATADVTELDERIAGLGGAGVSDGDLGVEEFRTELQQELAVTRSAGARSLDETRAHLEVRIDSLAAGLEAQVASVRDGLWDRVGKLQGIVESTDAAMGTRTAGLEQALGETHARLAEVADELQQLRRRAADSAAPPVGAIRWVWDEAIAWSTGLASASWALANYAARVIGARPA